jgi:hypothetical protein
VLPLHRSSFILLFGPGTAILPSRPSSSMPSRAAVVKAGHRPPRVPRGLALTAASTAALEHLRLTCRWRILGTSLPWTL